MGHFECEQKYASQIRGPHVEMNDGTLDFYSVLHLKMSFVF